MWTLIVTFILLAAALFSLLYFFKDKRALIYKIACPIPFVLISTRFLWRIANNTHIAYILQGIPFQICGMTSIILIVIAYTRNKVAFNLVYFITMPATVFAMSIDKTALAPISDFNYWWFVIPHMLYLILPLSMLVFSYMKPEIKMIKWVFVTFVAIIAIMHCLNLLTGALFPLDNGFPTTNYIFTMFPGDCIGPPTYDYVEFGILIDAFNILPVKGLYLVLLFPILAVVWAVLSVPLFIIERKRARLKKCENK